MSLWRGYIEHPATHPWIIFLHFAPRMVRYDVDVMFIHNYHFHKLIDQWCVSFNNIWNKYHPSWMSLWQRTNMAMKFPNVFSSISIIIISFRLGHRNFRFYMKSIGVPKCKMTINLRSSKQMNIHRLTITNIDQCTENVTDYFTNTEGIELIYFSRALHNTSISGNEPTIQLQDVNWNRSCLILGFDLSFRLFWNRSLGLVNVELINWMKSKSNTNTPMKYHFLSCEFKSLASVIIISAIA